MAPKVSAAIAGVAFEVLSKFARGAVRTWALADSISTVGRASEDDGEDGRRSRHRLQEWKAD